VPPARRSLRSDTSIGTSKENDDDDIEVDEVDEGGHGAEYRQKTRERIAREMEAQKKQLERIVSKAIEKGTASNDKAREPLFRLELLDVKGIVHSCVVYEVRSTNK
jgi:hypothetical protein